jgi:protein-S-isoprenylcysteine O-methyltransferase Ste14
MKLKSASILAFVIAVAGIVYLMREKHVLSYNPFTIVIQVCAFALMVWARITFGRRSFHAAANPTKGDLVTTGPYKYLRHPIYAAVIYFFWASVISYPSLRTVVAVLLITAGLFTRMIIEERFLRATYEEYAEYAKRSKRIIPFVF